MVIVAAWSALDLLLASPEFRERYRLIAEIGPPPLVRAFALAPGTPARAADVTRCF